MLVLLLAFTLGATDIVVMVFFKNLNFWLEHSASNGQEHDQRI